MKDRNNEDSPFWTSRELKVIGLIMKKREDMLEHENQNWKSTGRKLKESPHAHKFYRNHLKNLRECEQAYYTYLRNGKRDAYESRTSDPLPLTEKENGWLSYFDDVWSKRDQKRPGPTSKTLFKKKRGSPALTQQLEPSESSYSWYWTEDELDVMGTVLKKREDMAEDENQDWISTIRVIKGSTDEGKFHGNHLTTTGIRGCENAYYTYLRNGKRDAHHILTSQPHLLTEQEKGWLQYYDNVWCKRRHKRPGPSATGVTRRRSCSISTPSESPCSVGSAKFDGENERPKKILATDNVTFESLASEPSQNPSFEADERFIKVEPEDYDDW